jgi:hypothetical protein
VDERHSEVHRNTAGFGIIGQDIDGVDPWLGWALTGHERIPWDPEEVFVHDIDIRVLGYMAWPGNVKEIGVRLGLYSGAAE